MAQTIHQFLKQTFNLFFQGTGENIYRSLTWPCPQSSSHHGLFLFVVLSNPLCSHPILSCAGGGGLLLCITDCPESVFTSTISTRKSWGVFPGSHSLPFSVFLCPISLAMGPCGLLCQLALLLAPCWVSDMTRDQRVGIRENLDISPSLPLSTILTVAAFQP